MKIINSDDNKLIKDLYKLKKNRNREIHGHFIIDGKRELEIAIESGIKIEQIFVCKELIEDSDPFFNNLDEKICTIITLSIFKKLSYKDKPDGFLALAQTTPQTLEDVNLNKESIFIILESVEKPGNLGAIIRTAYAAGVKTIILADNQTKVHNPNVIRASEGMVFKMNIIDLSSADALFWLRSNKIKIYSTTTENSELYTSQKYKSKSALVFGSEANGLTDFWMKNADYKIKIPMVSNIDSLNVSVSVAIVLYEVKRQKELKK